MGKQKKHNLKWIQQTLELQPDHHWQATPGYKIFIADRGAVRFEIPQDWILKPQEKSFKFLDGEPPDDNCCLEMSYNRLPPVDLSDFPLAATLKQIAEQDERDVISVGEVVTLKRQVARIVWVELKFIDSQENREAFSRICVGLGSGIQVLLTFDYWADEADRCVPIWEVVLRSLVLGLYIGDPTRGTALPD